MIAILWNIFKILIIALLSILGIIVFLILLILLVPIAYKLEVEHDATTTRAEVGGSWFLIIRFFARYVEKKFSFGLKICGIPLISSEKREKNKHKNRHKDKQKKDHASNISADKTTSVAKESTKDTDSITEEQNKDTANVVLEQSKVTEIVAEEQADNVEKVVESELQAPENVTKAESQVTKSSSDVQKDVTATQEMVQETAQETTQDTTQPKKIRWHFLHPAEIYDYIITKILSWLDVIEKKYRQVKRNIRKVFREIVSETNREYVLFILGEVKKIFKHILPRKHRIYLHLGFADPSLTGELLGAYAVIKNALGLNWILEPEFEQEVLEVKMQLKGRIQLLQLLIIAIRVYFNKTTRKLLRRK